MPDWTVLTTQGRGRFVGMNLHVWFPVGGWWGEGDEKFFIDGEKFPSWFGTGSEDYFGYAWGDPAFFERPYHSQPLNEQNRGHIDDNRWHIVDNVPFQKTFEGCIEKYQSDAQSRYAATAFWYLAPGGTDAYASQPVEERTGYWIEPMQVAQIIKGKDMHAVTKPQHELDLSRQMYFTLPRMWSDDEQLWWMAKAPGELLDLQFPVAAAGYYRVSLSPTLAPNSGIVQLSVDGKNVGAPIDFYYREVTAGDALILDTLQLSAGLILSASPSPARIQPARTVVSASTTCASMRRRHRPIRKSRTWADPRRPSTKRNRQNHSPIKIVSDVKFFLNQSIWDGGSAQEAMMCFSRVGGGILPITERNGRFKYPGMDVVDSAKVG
jgi:hypothetical protein